MTAETLVTNTPIAAKTPIAANNRIGSARRMWSLARAEALLLWRNRTAMLNAVALPIGMVAVLATSGILDGTEELDVGAMIVTMMVSTTLLIVVYYNLVTAWVARREELVLKRLRTGEVNDAEILLGTAVPSVAIAWGQILIVVVAAFAMFDLDLPVNALIVVVAIVLGTAVFMLLAAVSTAMTRNVETAQVTTMPVLLVPLVASGLFFPLDKLPEFVESVARFLPLTPVVDLLRLGLTGTTIDGGTVGAAASFGAAVVPLLVLGVWVGAGVWATRRWFRWEPRR